MKKVHSGNYVEKVADRLQSRQLESPASNYLEKVIGDEIHYGEGIFPISCMIDTFIVNVNDGRMG